MPSLYYLEKRVPEQNQRRFYAIRIACGVFGEWAVVREWGRIGSPGTVRSLWFDSESAAQADADLLRQRKQKKGYRLIR
jgi:predicted DNA-binding WGR domain protein